MKLYGGVFRPNNVLQPSKDLRQMQYEYKQLFRLLSQWTLDVRPPFLIQVGLATGNDVGLARLIATLEQQASHSPEGLLGEMSQFSPEEYKRLMLGKWDAQ